MIKYSYRLMHAVMLDRGIYEEVEHDRTATPQALATVLLSSVAAGIGAGGLAGPTLEAQLMTSGVALATWVAWAVLVQQIGMRWWPARQSHADTGQLLRTLGFAAAPGYLQVFAVFDPIATPVFIAAWAWMLAAMVVAVRQALDYQSTWRAVVTASLALGLAVTLALVFGLVFGPAAY